MCGIVGVLGQLEAAPRILDALRRLEYRGYDSAGLTVLENGVPVRRRAVGKLRELVRLVSGEPLHGTAGIGHTRWATHGAPTLENAHPHAAGPVHVVHNGIVENARALRAELAEAGTDCATETDTEVVAQLVAAAIARGETPERAVDGVLGRLEGAFALAFLFEGHTDLMIVARHGSPLAIGWGEGEMFVGSDALALSPMTSRITYLDDGDMAVLTREGARIRDAAGHEVERAVRTVALDEMRMDKAGHRHFMAKEIAEQAGVLESVIAHYLSGARAHVASGPGTPDWAGASRVIITACGTACYAAMVAKYWFEQIAGIAVEVDIASELRYRDPPLDGREIAIFVSQSGETADTLAALRHFSGRVSATVGIVNVAESSIAREAGMVLPTGAGPEIGVASTKAFTAQLAVLAAAALAAARARGRIDADAEAARIAHLRDLPRLAREALALGPAIERIAQEIAMARDVLYLGRGRMFPLALEGALKLKEISYIHAEGHASGELKHGPIALIDEAVPVVVVAPCDDLFHKTISNMQEVMARGARVLLITDRAGAAAAPTPWRLVTLPDCAPETAPILYALPLQLLAYHTALAKGTDVDQPRNLAKSVTVE